MQTVKIQTTGGLTHVFVGECELKKITSVTFDQSVDTVPCFTFETIGHPNIEIENADICFRFTPETMQEAAKVICHGFSIDKVLYDAFVASIESVLKELPAGTGLYDVAEAVADRIIGKEE